MNTENFFKGLLYGVVLGAVAGVLLAPKAGSETRQDIKNKASELGDKAMGTYNEAKDRVTTKINELRSAGEKIDLDSYKKLVKRVVDELKNDSEVSNDVAKRLGEKLNADWNDVKESLKA